MQPDVFADDAKSTLLFYNSRNDTKRWRLEVSFPNLGEVSVGQLFPVVGTDILFGVG